MLHLERLPFSFQADHVYSSEEEGILLSNPEQEDDQINKLKNEASAQRGREKPGKPKGQRTTSDPPTNRRLPFHHQLRQQLGRSARRRASTN
jgi:hypothetical protein